MAGLRAGRVPAGRAAQVIPGLTSLARLPYREKQDVVLSGMVFLHRFVLSSALAVGALACGASQPTEPADAGIPDSTRTDAGAPTPGVVTLRLRDRLNRPLAGRPVALRVESEELRGTTDADGELRFEVMADLDGNARISATTARRERRITQVVGSWFERLGDVGVDLGDNRWRVSIEDDTAEETVDLAGAASLRVDPTLAGLAGRTCRADVQLAWGTSAVREGLRSVPGPCERDWETFVVAAVEAPLWGVLEVFSGSRRIALARRLGGAVDGLGLLGLSSDELPETPGLEDETRHATWSALLASLAPPDAALRRRIFFSVPNGLARLFVGSEAGGEPPPPLPEGFGWPDLLDGLEVDVPVGASSLRLLDGSWEEPSGWVESGAIGRVLANEGYWP